MEQSNIYEDIATRTEGDIYIGVVGPVRTGKSTFIKRFMEQLVIPSIPGEYRRERATDELPQSAAGRTIMTTEPKFIPEEAVRISTEQGSTMQVRLIDCVGYIVPSALGYFEEDRPRMVKTPWFEEEIPFNMAAEIGTRKVIREHSTIGLVVTTDGSIGDIPREEYREAEERVIAELRELGKPFAVVLNCRYPQAASAQELRQQLEESYGTPVLAVNCMELEEADIRRIFSGILGAFPVRELCFAMPRWILSLPREHWLKAAVCRAIAERAAGMQRMDGVAACFADLSCEYIRRAAVQSLDHGTGSVRVAVEMDDSLFYRVLQEETGIEIENEAALIPCLTELAAIRRAYEKIRGALEEVNATGYGIVMPSLEELRLEEPEITKQGGKYGVRLRASAPSIHLMKADIMTEVAPVVGSEKQSEELVNYLLQEFQENPAKIWESNIFGKSLHELVNEGLHNKLYRMPGEARVRLQETIERIINDGCSGLICIII